MPGISVPGEGTEDWGNFEVSLGYKYVGVVGGKSYNLIGKPLLRIPQ